MEMIAGRQKLAYESNDKVVWEPLLGVLYDPTDVHGAAVVVERVEHFERGGDVVDDRTRIILTVTEALKLIEHLSIAVSDVLSCDENFTEGAD